MMTFNELGLKEEILSAIAELGYENPMPVQAEVIPYMLENDTDLVALAQTGTGKTAAFGLPVLHKIDASKKAIQALILAPTRELCIQISNDLKNYAKNMRGTKVVPVYGGENIVTQFKQLDIQPQVLVATPGRLIDLIQRGKVRLGDVKYVVLDEADEMLSMGFKDDLETILEEVPAERHTLLFSATMPKEVANMARNYMNNAKEISIGTRNSGSDNVEHVYYMVMASNRYLALKRILDVNPNIYSIVFCRTRMETKDVAEKLMKDGYNADALHGDLSQAQRDAVMNKFRIKNLQVLVATDVAARGLDVNNLTHVINYNLPDDIEVYTHRSGRTGRANKKGTSVAIIHTRERGRLRDIERIIKKEFKQVQVPTGLEVCKKQLFHLVDKMENVEMDGEQLDSFMPQIYSKLEYLTKEELIKRFVSLEFNRFLDYYKSAEDINVTANDAKRGERRERERDDRRADRGERKKGGRRVRLKMNIGTKQNANPRMVLGIINDVTQDKSISIGDIEITNKFTFFDVFTDQMDKVIDAFANNGRNGMMVSQTEPREVTSNAPRRSTGGDRGRKNGGGNKREKGGGNYRSEKADRNSWEKFIEDDNAGGKPWRKRR